jgi:hypothetical protein
VVAGHFGDPVITQRKTGDRPSGKPGIDHRKTGDTENRGQTPNRKPGTDHGFAVD